MMDKMPDVKEFEYDQDYDTDEGQHLNDAHKIHSQPHQIRVYHGQCLLGLVWLCRVCMGGEEIVIWFFLPNDKEAICTHLQKRISPIQIGDYLKS